MTIYDENEHPRGQSDNAGQFRDKSNSGPEVALVAPAEPVRPPAVMAESIVLANYLPAEAVVFANYLPEDGQTAEDVLQEALNDRVLGANDIMSLIRAGVTSAPTEPVLTPDAIADVIVFANYLPEDGQTAEDVLQEALDDRVLGANDIMSLICAGVIAARAEPVRTPDAIVEPLVEGASFEALAGTNGYHYLNALLVTAANHAQLAQAKAVIDDIIQDEGNYGDATAEEYAAYAVANDLLPHKVNYWAHLVESATPSE